MLFMSNWVNIPKNPKYKILWKKDRDQQEVKQCRLLERIDVEQGEQTAAHQDCQRH